MERIISILKKENLECLPCEFVNLDFERFTEYRDNIEHPAEGLYENPKLKNFKMAVSDLNSRSIIKYFLDGSRKTYKIADIIHDRRYLPIISGQVGVAVTRRSFSDNSITIFRDFCRFENVIAFPEILKDDLKAFEKKINQKTGQKFRLLTYRTKSKEKKDPVDLGVAQIMRRMHDMEIEIVNEMSKKSILKSDAMLVIDGPLRFKELKGREFDITQFRNVIGISKNFQPSIPFGERRPVQVGTITSKLDFGERTTVFKAIEGSKNIGMWYLRIRPRSKMSNPLQGIIKIERFAIENEEIELGLNSEIIDILSANILKERNVTPYGKDSRWASHIYPVYLAEKFIKTSFLSDIHFKGYF